MIDAVLLIGQEPLGGAADLGEGFGDRSHRLAFCPVTATAAKPRAQ